MKISRVESFLMSYPMPEPIRLPFWGGERRILKRDAMLLRVTADTGLRGYAPGPAHERADREIRQVVSAFLTGKDPRQWQTLRVLADQEGMTTYRAVEIAVLDLVARYEGCPLSDLLGGRKRDRMKVYGSAGMYMEPEAYAEEARVVADMGFPAYKMRPGMGPEQDLRTVALMREAVGPDVGLMIDAHTWWRMGNRSYDVETVARLVEGVKDYDPVWLEEPLPPDDHAAYHNLRARSDVKLASGEHEPDEAGFRHLIESDAVDYVQMDILCQGGVPTAQRVFQNVEKEGLRFAFHSWGTALEVLAAAQLGVCWSEDVVEWLEYPCYAEEGCPVMYPFPLANEILSDLLKIENGYLVLPEGPGLGIEVNEAVVQKYPFVPGPWSLFRLDSPAETVAVTGDHSVKWVQEETSGD
ncbi:MAG: mandelate racemase/muconate lactonizing enzyme family protein [Phycisphaerales bacterium]|nr:MAG: mandelate racemase/muconate lactonizing enzyme family protein [Phycisphaerales bacterium]